METKEKKNDNTQNNLQKNEKDLLKHKTRWYDF